MNPNDDIQKLVVAAAELDNSRALEVARKAVVKRYKELLEEKDRRLKVEIAEKRITVIEKKGEAALLKHKIRSTRNYIESRRQYNDEIVKGLAEAKERLDTLVKRYKEMLKSSTERWESNLKIYNNFPLAKKKIELENKLKLTEFQILYQTQREGDFKQAVAQRNNILSLQQAALEREIDQRDAERENMKARLEELDHYKKEKMELIARLRAKKDEQEREKQRLSEIAPAGSVSLAIPLMSLPKQGQLALSQHNMEPYGSLRAPAFSHLSQTFPALTQKLPSSSQGGVLMSFNRTEVHSRIIEERRFVVVPARTASSAPNITYSTTSPNDNPRNERDIATPSKQETSTPPPPPPPQVAPEAGRPLVDPNYAGSDSSQDAANELVSQDGRISEEPIPNTQIDRQELHSSNIPQSTHCSYAVSTTCTSQHTQFSVENFQPPNSTTGTSTSAQPANIRSPPPHCNLPSSAAGLFVTSPFTQPNLIRNPVSPIGRAISTEAPRPIHATPEPTAPVRGFYSPGRASDTCQRYQPYPSPKRCAVTSYPGVSAREARTSPSQQPIPVHPASQPAPRTATPTSCQPTTAECRNLLPQPIQRVPAGLPSLPSLPSTLNSGMEPTPPPAASSQRQTCDESQQSTEVREILPVASQAECETSSYFNNGISFVPNQEFQSPRRNGEDGNDTHSDQGTGSKTSDAGHDFQPEDIDLGDDLTCPQFSDEGVYSSPDRLDLLKSPTSPPLTEFTSLDKNTGFGGFGIPSAPINPFGFSSSNNADAADESSQKTTEVFTFLKRSSNKFFQLF